MVDAQTHMKTAQILGHLTTPDSVVKLHYYSLPVAKPIELLQQNQPEAG
jgi:hypothetical protein